MTNPTVRISRRFDVPAEKVFAAWLDPKLAGQWLFATPAGKMVKVEIDPRVGGSFNFTDRRDNQDIQHVGTYLEIDPPKRLVFQFAVPKFSKEFTKVTIDIKPLPAGCELTLTHEGILPEYEKRTQQGWRKLLSSLASNIDPNSAYGQLIAPDTLRFQRLLPGPIERVWAYLTESDKRAQWFAAGAAEPRVGGKLELNFNHSTLSKEIEEPPEKFAKHANNKPGPNYIQKITRYEPPKFFAWAWDAGMDGQPSEVIFELTQQGDNVLLTLTHRKLSKKYFTDVAPGWHSHLEILIERLNNREPHSIWRYLDEIDGQYETRLSSV